MKKIEDYVLSIPDFPEPGIIFRDIRCGRDSRNRVQRLYLWCTDRI